MKRARPSLSQFRSLEIRRTTFLKYMNFGDHLIPGRPFHTFRSPRSGDQLILCLSGTSWDGFWSSKILKESVRYVIYIFTNLPRNLLNLKLSVSTGAGLGAALTPEGSTIKTRKIEDEARATKTDIGAKTLLLEDTAWDKDDLQNDMLFVIFFIPQKHKSWFFSPFFSSVRFWGVFETQWPPLAGTEEFYINGAGGVLFLSLSVGGGGRNIPHERERERVFGGKTEKQKKKKRSPFFLVGASLCE